MANISYNRVWEPKDVLKGAREIDSVAGTGFVDLQQDLARRIQRTNAEYSFIIARARDIQIGASASIDSVDVDDLLNEATNFLTEHNIDNKVGNIDVVSDVLARCLASATPEDVVAQRIVLSNQTARSRKLTNIVFKQTDFVRIILDTLFFIKDISAESVLDIIGKSFYILLNVLSSINVDFNQDCKTVLLGLYKNSRFGVGIDEEELKNVLLVDMNQVAYKEAIDTLCKYRCIEIIEGRIYLVESIGFKMK